MTIFVSESKTFPNQEFKKNESISIKMLSEDNATNSDSDLLVEIDHDYALVSEETHVLSAVVNELSDQRKVANIYSDRVTQLPGMDAFLTWPSKSSSYNPDVMSFLKISKDVKTGANILESPELNINNTTITKTEGEQSTVTIFINRHTEEDLIQNEANKINKIKDTSNQIADYIFPNQILLKGVQVPVYFLKSSSNFSENMDENILESPAVRIKNVTSSTISIKNAISSNALNTYNIQSTIRTLLSKEDQLQNESNLIKDKNIFEDETDLFLPYDVSLKGVEIPENFFESSSIKLSEKSHENISESPEVKMKTVPTSKTLNEDEQSTITIFINSKEDSIPDEESEIKNKPASEKEADSSFSQQMVVAEPENFFQLSNKDFGETLKSLLPFKNNSNNVNKIIPVVLKIQ